MPCRTRGHNKAPARPESVRFRDDTKKCPLEGKGSCSGICCFAPENGDARNHELLVSPELDAKVPSAGLFLAQFADVQRWVVGFGVFETMNESIGGPPDEAPAAVDAWKAPCANGAVFAVIAVSLLWGAFRPFKPPPEEPKDVTAILDDTEEITRFGKEFMQLSRERSRITNWRWQWPSVRSLAGCSSVQASCIVGRPSHGLGQRSVDVRERPCHPAWATRTAEGHARAIRSGTKSSCSMWSNWPTPAACSQPSHARQAAR